MKSFLSIGKDNISKKNFMPISNTGTSKPIGGLWATRHEIKYIYYNDWADYLACNPHVLFYKYKDYQFNLPGVYFTLKDSANILTISCIEDLEAAKNAYPLDGWIDFEAMALDYDGIFINIMHLMHENHELDSIIKTWSVNSLVLFNVECILEYQKAHLVFDTYDEYALPPVMEYEIDVEPEKLCIEQDLKLTRKKDVE